VKDEFDENQYANNYSIKSEVSNGKTISTYIYNNIGEISESEALYSYSRYSYDNEGRLVKRESVMDISLSSSISVEKTEFMTAENCTITNNQFFKYDNNDKLIEIENHSKKDNGEFVFTSKFSFEYDKENIIKRKLHNEEGIITQFDIYQYNGNGNLINKKHYSYLFSENSEPRITSETSYKYDTKKNPFVIFKELGNPGLFTNTNNVIESNSISYVLTSGLTNYSTSRTTYEYNRNNYPVKAIGENSEYEYKY
jgi:hypothetical protein